MDSTRSLAATVTAAPVPGVAAPRQAPEPSASDVFAALLRDVGGRFSFNPNSVSASDVLQAAPQTKEPAPVDRDDQTNVKKDAQVDDSSDKKNASTEEKTTSTHESDSAQTQDETGAVTVTDPAMAAQISAIQALLLTQQQAAPVVTEVAVAVATTTTPQDVLAAVDPNTPVTDLGAKTENVGPATETVDTADTVTTPQNVTAQAQAATVETVATPGLKAFEDRPAMQAKTDVLTPQAQTTTTDAPAAAAQTETSTVKTQGAQQQSEALTKLLGDTNAIRIAVTVDPQMKTTQTASVYDQYAGYSMGDTKSLANGGETISNALVADPEAPVQPNAAVQAVAAAQVAPNAGIQNQPTMVARTDVAPTAVTAIGGAAESGSADRGAFGQTGLSGQNNTAATTAANKTNNTQQPQQPANPAEVFEQIKVKITRATKAGLDQVSIALKPEALGRVDIKLEVSPDGKVHAAVTVDRPETLALLQNDAQGLEKTLNDAGLRADANNLSFNLRSNGDGSGNAGAPNGGAQYGDAGTDEETLDESSYDYVRAALQRGGVDTYA